LPNTLPPIADQEMTPLVKKLVAQIDALLEVLQRANSEIGQLRDEIAVLKGEKARPKFKPSKMEESTDKTDAPGDSASSKEGDKVKRAGSAKRSKTAQLQIHEERVIAPEFLPPVAQLRLAPVQPLPCDPAVAAGAIEAMGY
jgi:ribosomal protein S17